MRVELEATEHVFNEVHQFLREHAQVWKIRTCCPTTSAIWVPARTIGYALVRKRDR